MNGRKGSSGRAKPSRRALASATPQTRAFSRQLNAKGPSINSRLQRAIYFSLQDQQTDNMLEQKRQQDAATLLHYDTQPNWDAGPSPLATANLQDAPNGGQAAGSLLTAGGTNPPEGFIPGPQ